jgi:hypothetical protein
VANIYDRRNKLRSHALDHPDKDADEAFLLGLAALLILVLTVLVWSMVHA